MHFITFPQDRDFKREKSKRKSNCWFLLPKNLPLNFTVYFHDLSHKPLLCKNENNMSVNIVYIMLKGRDWLKRNVREIF